MSSSLPSSWGELDVARHKSEFYRMWHTGYRAGLPHPKVMATVGDFRRSPQVQRQLKVFLEGTRRGESLTDIIRAQPELFFPFEAALLELGEESGQLEEMLAMLGKYFAVEHRMVLAMKQKMSYPMFTTLAAIFIAPFPLLFFGNAAAYLMIVVPSCVALLLFGGGLLLAVARWYRGRPQFVVARLCRALALGVEAGLPLGRVIDLGVKSAANVELTNHVARVPVRERGNQPLAQTFGGSTVVPREVIAAMEVADTTGDYRNTLRKLAEMYDGEP